MSSSLANLSNSDGKARLAAITEFKATLESADPQVCISLQQDALPHLLQVLKDTDASMSSLSIENQVRSAVLETLHRFTLSEAFKPGIADVMSAITDVLQNDNEENACSSLKLFIDMHKAYKTSIEECVQPFLDIVLKIYQNMPIAVRDSFDSIAAVPGNSHLTRTAAVHSPMSPSVATDAAENLQLVNKPLCRSMHSFKVLTECPIIIVLLFSTYRQIVQTNLVMFTPAIIDMLSLQAPALTDAAKSSLMTSSTRKQLFADLMLAQIKTLSFLAYLLRGYTTFMKKYAQIIPQFVLRLLRDCPPEMSAARKV